MSYERDVCNEKSMERRDVNSRLSEDDIIKLGKSLWYTDGWEMLALKLKLTFSQVENIRQDNPYQCK